MSRIFRWSILMACLPLLWQPPIARSDDAPASFEPVSNGLVSERQFQLDREIFERKEQADGAHNHVSCVACHFQPMVGAGSQIQELRVGRFDGVNFSGGRLVLLANADPDAIQASRPTASENVRSFRASIPLFGVGFVEALSNVDLQRNVASQPASMRGILVLVDLEVSPGTRRVGRFGWKSQHAAIPDFVRDASVAELGEDAAIDSVDNEQETRFLRSLPVPPRNRDAACLPEVILGERLFADIGCAICHTRFWRTLPAGTLINGGTFTLVKPLSDAVIQPFSDFAIHDLGDELVDGIVQNGPPSTRRGVRTPALWGLRARMLLGHDGRASTVEEFILLHRGQASGVTHRFRSLPPRERTAIISFLATL